MPIVESSFYSQFLLVLSQLSVKQKATVCVEDQEISIEVMPGRKRWKLAMQLYGDLPEEISCCLATCTQFQWQHAGAFLQRDAQSGAIFLIEEIDVAFGKYTLFRQHLLRFLKAAKEWQTL